MSLPATKKNLYLKIAYDGTHYLGWQKTPMGPSIQESVEIALETIMQEKVCLEAASRTDAGVHALGQVANFYTTRTIADLERFRWSLNSLLNKDIAVLEMREVDEHFHPTLDNKGKEYLYYVCQGPYQIPINRFFSWHVPDFLDIEKMQKAAQSFIGEKDFKALLTEKNEHPYKDYVREIWSIDIKTLEGNRIVFDVAGKSFLYKMVRTIVGTLVYVGKGKIAVEDIPSILKSGDRARAGITAPAHGLHLSKILL